MNWKNKKVLVTGSEGMIGKELTEQLSKLSDSINVYYIDKVGEYNNTDLTYKNICEAILSQTKPDYVFHLAGIKGNPKMTNERPVDFMGPMLQFDTNMIIAAQETGVKRFLYTSSIAVEHPESDKYPAWAKQTGETLIEAMRIQYPKGTKYTIVRPSNVYGRYDNFDNPNAMVITSLISKVKRRAALELWGDGGQIRDFINSKDVARGMIKAMEDMPDRPVNLCSGKGISIKQVVEIISKETRKPIKHINTQGKIMGQDRRVMMINWDFKPEIDIAKGIKEVIEWIK
ncbi:MAG: NAD(P)-dependent oxidoreductase [Bacteroidetes bacterium]|nr:NAD(P)-dependent oxidoreductase [Bacteroidota bacterium]